MYFGMKNFYIVALTTVFFTSNAFGYSCYFRPYSGNIRVADINGRQIYTLFTTHLSNQPDEYRDILNSGIDIIERTDGFIAEHLDRINSERSDFLQILSLLTSQRIDWIGIEANPENMQIVEKKVQDYRRSKEFLIRVVLTKRRLMI